jgi:D-3-phosphoglycerate dehydrogenase
MPNTVNIPHLGASTLESEDNCAVMAAQQLVDFLECGNIRNSVNYPSVSIPHTGAARICIAHLNVANMLSQITSVISAKGINIENLSNGSIVLLTTTVSFLRNWHVRDRHGHLTTFILPH